MGRVTHASQNHRVSYVDEDGTLRSHVRRDSEGKPHVTQPPQHQLQQQQPLQQQQHQQCQSQPPLPQTTSASIQNDWSQPSSIVDTLFSRALSSATRSVRTGRRSRIGKKKTREVDVRQPIVASSSNVPPRRRFRLHQSLASQPPDTDVQCTATPAAASQPFDHGRSRLLVSSLCNAAATLPGNGAGARDEMFVPPEPNQPPTSPCDELHSTGDRGVFLSRLRQDACNASKRKVASADINKNVYPPAKRRSSTSAHHCQTNSSLTSLYAPSGMASLRLTTVAHAGTTGIANAPAGVLASIQRLLGPRSNK